MSQIGLQRQAAFFGPTVANWELRTWLDRQLAPPSRDSTLNGHRQARSPIRLQGVAFRRRYFVAWRCKFGNSQEKIHFNGGM